MHEHPHRGFLVVDAVEVAFGERPEVPQAGVHLLEGLGEVVLVFTGLLALGVVQSRAIVFWPAFPVGSGRIRVPRKKGI